MCPPSKNPYFDHAWSFIYIKELYIISISVQPDVLDLSYFKLWILWTVKKPKFQITHLNNNIIKQNYKCSDSCDSLLEFKMSDVHSSRKWSTFSLIKIKFKGDKFLVNTFKVEEKCVMKHNRGFWICEYPEGRIYGKMSHRSDEKVFKK